MQQASKQQEAHSSSASTVCVTNARRSPEDTAGVAWRRGRTRSSISRPRALRTVRYCGVGGGGGGGRESARGAGQSADAASACARARVCWGLHRAGRDSAGPSSPASAASCPPPGMGPPCTLPPGRQWRSGNRSRSSRKAAWGGCAGGGAQGCEGGAERGWRVDGVRMAASPAAGGRQAGGQAPSRAQPILTAITSFSSFAGRLKYGTFSK